MAQARTSKTHKNGSKARREHVVQDDPRDIHIKFLVNRDEYGKLQNLSKLTHLRVSDVLRQIILIADKQVTEEIAKDGKIALLGRQSS